MPEKMTAAAAKICYSNVQDVDTLMDDLTEEKIDSFLDKMKELQNHGTPWEHPSFTFAIEGVSRAMSMQLVRHRLASYDQQSQRYCDGENFDYITPPSIEKNPEMKEGYDRLMKASKDVYRILVANGVPKEDARYVFTNACTTRLITTMNVRSLMHFFALRCCLRAQWEIRAMADEMLKICKETAPKLFEKAGSSCVQLGYCPEGKMSCGKAPTLNELLKAYNEKG